MRAKKAQSTVEYILLVTAVIVIVVLFTTAKGPGTFQGGLNSVFGQMTNVMVNTANQVQ